MTVEEFVGGKVKYIRVNRYDPKLSPEQIRERVRTSWLGIFNTASRFIRWSEAVRWNIAAIVEFEDEIRTHLVIDGAGHVQVQDRVGNIWYLRLRPSV